MIVSTSADLSSTLDTSPRPQETGFTWVTYVDTSHIKIIINMNNEKHRAPLILAKKYKYKILVFSSIVQLFDSE